jgi:aldose 1-epimerase
MAEVVEIAAGRLAAVVARRGATLAALAVDGAPVALAPAEPGADGIYMGAICGRVANRLGHARARVAGRVVTLAPNEGPHILHGGAAGLSGKLWDVVAAGPAAVQLAVESADGEAGFPGRLRVRADWAIAPPATLRLTLAAETDAATPVNLCQHIYFNLDGAATVDAHRLMVAAERYLVADAALIPTGAVAGVAGTPLDYRAPRPVGRHDATLVLADAPRAEPALAARLAAGGRVMEVWTTEPALHLYTGDYIPAGLPLAGGRTAGPRAGLCLEAMGWTDAPNHPHFPQITLLPGARYRTVTEFRFA